MTNPLEKLSDADLVYSAAQRAAPLTNVVGLPESVEMMRRTKGWLRDLHVAVRLTTTLVVLTVVLVLLTVAPVYFVAHR
jgi:hypothetical protein